MDFVYSCRKGDNEELRYSIRSVVKNYPNANIWVVGGKPSWYIGNYIPVEQNKSKYANAKTNLNTLVKSKDIQSDFILMNDDFFILEPVNEIEIFNNGFLINRVKQGSQKPSSSYYKMLRLTYNNLLRAGHDNPLNYELHVPMPMNKDKFKNVLKQPGLWRSNYGNMYKIGGKAVSDVKIYSLEDKKMPQYYNKTNDLPYISTSDTSFVQLFDPFFKDLFPEPSQYEKLV